MCWTARAAERRLRRGLPHRRVSGDGCQEGVPGPHRHRKVECGDHPDDPERMPVFVHAMLGALGLHGEAVQHARLADREIGDVDHLLNFAVALGLDLAVLERHEAPERVLVQSQFLGDQPDDLAALGRRHGAPLPGGLDRRREHALVVRRGRPSNLREPRAGGRIDGLDQGSRGLVAPAAGPGAGIHFAKTERLQGGGDFRHEEIPSWDFGAAFCRAARGACRAPLCTECRPCVASPACPNPRF